MSKENYIETLRASADGSVLKYISDLEAKLAIAKEALEYCAIEPGFLYPENNAQHLRAHEALEKLKRRAIPSE